jgi:hypothetical protein
MIIVVYSLAVLVFFVFIIAWLRELIVLTIRLLIVMSNRGLLLMLFPRLPRLQAALHMLLASSAL